jgi:eukaryotic-like serine/threonine-protein kinase
MSEWIAGFEILDKISEGGMGVVFKARDPGLDRIVAVKVLRTGFDSPEQRARFKREARSAARLENQHIVTIFSFGEHEERRSSSRSSYVGRPWSN